MSSIMAFTTACRRRDTGHTLARCGPPPIIRSIALALLSAATCLAPGAGKAFAEERQLALQKVVAGLQLPVCIANAGDGSGRLFLCEQNGIVSILRGGELVLKPFLDVSARSSCCGERGLLSIAFPPGFAASGRFYVNYTDNAGNTVVSRFRISTDPDQADPGSEEVILRIEQPYSNHNGGQIAFGADGFLYVGMGDGGSAGDPGNRAQSPATPLGKMLRLDVESGASPYAVPASNPFAALAGYLPEIWALGLRNPWRFSFDRATGDLWIADVGQGNWEEVNRQHAASGGGENYGWRTMEGDHCYLPVPCSTAGLVRPVAEYSHAEGCSITGGYVYRGDAYPRLLGSYLYGDLCSGRIWTLRRVAGAWTPEPAIESPLAITAFGEDEAGELYVADYSGGDIHRIVDAAPGCALGCTATAPPAAPPGVAIDLHGSAVTSACAEPVTLEWELGDGSPPASGTMTTHAYESPGEWVWRFTARSGTATCEASGIIAVRPRFRRALRAR